MADPYTIEHFCDWASELVLDTGDNWIVEDWQQEIIADILSGIPEVWLVIPQGNAKTTLMAGVGLYHLDWIPDPWVPIGAASREQAEILFAQAGGFVERSPSIEHRFRVYDGYRKIITKECKDRPASGRGLKVYAADERTGDGVIPSMAIVDEGHRHRNLALYRTWRGKLRKRSITRTWVGPIEKRGGSIVMMSTAGEPASDFERTRENLKLEAVERVRSGRCHVRYAGAKHVLHDYAVPSTELVNDLEIVKEANPLSMITIAHLEDALVSPSLDFGEDWLRLTCNIPTRSSKAAVAEADWDRQEVADEIPPGVTISVGLDVAWVLDCTAIVPLWLRDGEYRLLGTPTILTPPRDGTMLDPQEVHDAILEMNERNPIEMIVLDKTRAEETAMWIAEELGCTVVERTQKNEQAAQDYEAFTEAIRRRWLWHTGDRGLRTHVMHAIAKKLPSDRYRFDRVSPSRSEAYQDERVIDALTAAAMVHFVAVAAYNVPASVPMVAVRSR